ncbi:hypothetical protein [uncultured Deinococcus sp.]|nr:hypothetical protein [uncultured Deinococcus sp.]
MKTLPGPIASDFDAWCDEKKQLHTATPSLVFQEAVRGLLTL